jgi:GMP synthase (glutamine-hydrolysing)
LPGDTFDLPAGAVLLARGELCPNQAFRYDPCAYGLQFHVEMTPPLLAEWLADPELPAKIGHFSYIDPLAIRADAPRQFPAMNSLSERVLRRFRALCQQRAGQDSAGRAAWRAATPGP